jgi:signal recognition particle subunit SRP14
MPDELQGFFEKYAEVVKGGMGSLKKRDRKARKKAKKKGKEGGGGGKEGV